MNCSLAISFYTFSVKTFVYLFAVRVFTVNPNPCCIVLSVCIICDHEKRPTKKTFSKHVLLLLA